MRSGINSALAALSASAFAVSAAALAASHSAICAPISLNFFSVMPGFGVSSGMTARPSFCSFSCSKYAAYSACFSL